MRGDERPIVALLEVDGTAGNVGDVHLGDLGVLALVFTGAVHAHDEDVLGTVGMVHIIDVQQVVVKMIGGL